MCFEIETFIVLGKASDEFKKFCSENGFVIEIACNDGILLEPLKNLELSVLGVDPA